jgi:curli biogenesis system outer membrane secretion channel CsgG
MIVLLPLLLLAACATSMGDRFRGGELEPYEHGQRFLVGVLAFQDTTGNPDLADLEGSFSGTIISGLQEYGRYRLIEKERIDSILEAQSFQLSGLVDPATAQELGRLLGVDAVCITVMESYEYSEERKSALIAWTEHQRAEVVLSSRIVSIATGEILASADARVSRGRKRQVAFGFLRRGGFTERETLAGEAINLAIRELAYMLSERAPGKG